MAIGVVDEYLGRIFIESKNRPLFLVDGYMRPRLDLPQVETTDGSQTLQEGHREC